MPKKCCLYVRGDGERWKLCTSDEKCPTIVGDTNLGSWNVEKCAECFSIESPGEKAPPMGDIFHRLGLRGSEEVYKFLQIVARALLEHDLIDRR